MKTLNLLLKEDRPKGFLETSRWVPVPEGEVDPREPLCVIEAYLTGGVAGVLGELEREGGLVEALFINAGRSPQYGVMRCDALMKDPEALAELSRYRTRAAALGCKLEVQEGERRRYWTVSHVVASTAETEIEAGVRILNAGAGKA